MYYYVCAVVEVNVDMGNVTVPESDPIVEICFSLSSGISESVVVTAETGPKDGANQATGTYIQVYKYYWVLYHLQHKFPFLALGNFYLALGRF